MEITIESITPVKAERWLNANKSNRKLRAGVTEKYAADMRDGRWTTCPTPIAFYDDGDVADGQHRLWAIVESGTTQRFPVARGLAREDGLNIDTGLGRTLVDNARISGKDAQLSTTIISTARAIHEGSAMAGRASNAAKLAIVGLHREAANWAAANGPRAKYLRNAVVLGAFGRAWYHESDHDRLKRCADVINTGFYAGDDEIAAVAIRNYLLQRGSQSSTAALWRDTFLKVQNAISYFMRGKKLTVIKAVGEEAYPMKRPPGKLRRAA